MKISIYIVDDEWMAIQYFNYLLEKINMKDQVIGQATNSVKALAEITRLQPDIVFADIDMPVMNGLELAEQIVKRQSSKVFLLTSYRDFDYIKKGIQIGVIDYILKNDLTEDVLKNLLEKADQDLAVERKQQHLILEHNVRRFLLSTSETESPTLYRHRSMQRYALISVVQRPKIRMRNQKLVETAGADCLELQDLSYPEGIKCNAFVEMEGNELCGIFLIREDVTDGQPLLKLAGEQIVSYLQERGMDYCCLISDTKYQFFDLQNSYHELQRLAEYIYAYPKQRIFCAEEFCRSHADSTMSDAWIGHINGYLESSAFSEIDGFLREMFAKWREHLNVWDYTDNLQNVYRFLKAYAQKQNLGLEMTEIPKQHLDAISQEEALLEYAALIGKEVEQIEKQNYSPYVEQAILYIRKNYCSDISIPDIAQAVNISEGHLRRLFKQELNMKVLDYLTDYRLKCAKILMKNKNDSLSDIWRKAGFASAQYFSYVFKRKEGVLPKDYMKQVRKG